MVEPKTQDVMSWLFTQIGSKYPSFHVPDLWVGMTDEVKEGEFRWLSDNTTVTQDFWAKGQPNNGPGNGPENCVVMASEYDELWDDVFCAFNYYDKSNMCQRPAIP